MLKVKEVESEGGVEPEAWGGLELVLRRAEEETERRVGELDAESLRQQ